jgi:hypothetical protein
LDFFRVHGLILASELELPELAPCRVAGRRPPPDVHIGRGCVADPEETRDLSWYVLPRGEAAVLGFRNIARFEVTSGRRVTVDVEPDGDPASVRLFLLGSAMGMVCHQRGMLALHASAVAFGGNVVAFVGHQGVGKSTLAAHCVEAGGRLVADDVLVVSFDERGRALAHPGLPRMKLWRQALEVLGRTPQGLIPDWLRADKYHLPCAEAATGAPLPLARVCLLEEDDAAGAGEHVAMKGAAAVAALIANTYRVEFLELVGGRDHHFRQCARLGRATEIVRLRRRHDAARLPTTAALVADSVTRLLQ